jgi:hypothetical protein
VLSVVQVPKHGDTILSTGSGEGSIWGDGEGVDVTSVTVVVCLELALGKFPNLNQKVSPHVFSRHTKFDDILVLDEQSKEKEECLGRIRDLGG